MIYESNNKYYLKQGDLYYLADIIIKSHTIIIYPTNEYITSIDNANLLSYDELKNKILGVTKNVK